MRGLKQNKDREPIHTRWPVPASHGLRMTQQSSVATLMGSFIGEMDLATSQGWQDTCGVCGGRLVSGSCAL